jgi:hypothetical protein
MAVSRDFANFLAVYDDLTGEVARTRYQFVDEHLANWYRALDDTSQVNRVIQRLESGLDFDDFLKRSRATGSSMAGSATFLWPEDRENRLGMKLQLFRRIAEGTIEAWQVGYDFACSGNDLDANSSALIRQVFMPMARELRRLLETEVGNLQADEIPASDRVVRLDHNSQEYKKTVEALDKLEEALKGDNEFPDPEEKEQRIAEVSAMKRLLQAVRVSVEKVKALGISTAVRLGAAIYSEAIKQAASAVLRFLRGLIGL